MKNIKFGWRPAICLVAAIGFFASSCQKKFDPNSYKPAETFGGYSASSQIASTDLVAYWAFNGSLVDSVSNTSCVNTGTTFGTGIVGQGLQCGLNTYAIFTPTTAIKNLQSATISFWVNTAENSTGIQEAICFANSTQFWSNLDLFFDGQSATGATFKIHAYGNGGNSEEWLTNWTLNNPWNTWQHYVLTYDSASATFNFYVNGSLYQSGTNVGTATAANFGALNFAAVPAIVFGTIQFMTTPSLTSGATSQSWASYLTGVLDEVRIYDKALDASDIAALDKLELLGR